MWPRLWKPPACLQLRPYEGVLLPALVTLCTCC